MIICIYSLEGRGSASQLIHNIYILKKTGESLIHGYYGSIEVDETLITGFLSAISTFAEEIGAESVESLVMKNMKFVYATDASTPDPLIFAICVDREEEPSKIENILLKIREKFVSGHKSDLADWDGDVNVFVPFYAELDEIIWEYVFNKYGKTFQEFIVNKKQPIDEVVASIHRLFSPKIATKLVDHVLQNLV